MADQEAEERSTPPNFTEHTFKTQQGAQLAIRLWAADPPVSQPAPFVIWTHGGGWMAGNHFAPLAWMDSGFRQRGYHMVSHSYRLGPQVNWDDQLQDCMEAIQWCRKRLPDILGKDRVDVDRYVICGESAGGHLALLMAFYLSPPPRAVINAYGASNPASTWPLLEDLSKSDYDAPWEGEYSEQELEAFLSDRDPNKTLTEALFFDEHYRYSEEIVSKQWASDFKFTPRIRLQADLHMWRSNTARLPMVVKSFLQGSIHAERFPDKTALEKYIRSVCPFDLLEGKDWYPPTAFLHGTADSAIPLEESQRMAQRLREMDMPVVECYEPGGEHVFDNKYKSPDVPGWDLYIQPLLDFCNQHVGRVVVPKHE